MLKLITGFIAACITSLVFGQVSGSNVPDTSTPMPEVSATATSSVAPVKYVLGLVKKTTEGAQKISDYCLMDRSKKLPGNVPVVLVRKVVCSPRNGGTVTHEFYEVLFQGKEFFLPLDMVFLLKTEAVRLAEIKQAQIDASYSQWKIDSLQLYGVQLDQVMKNIKAAEKFGIALLENSIYDVSQHTEGTGFSATVLNPSGTKTIKYVNFSILGRNAVGDPVGTVKQFRGIGPLGPGVSGTYSKDYMWMTDIVHSYSIRSIKVDFMDGTSKTVSDAKKIQISDDDIDFIDLINE